VRDLETVTNGMTFEIFEKSQFLTTVEWGKADGREGHGQRRKRLNLKNTINENRQSPEEINS
jgi:hypothetical protein